MGRAADLWNAHRDLADACLEHPFVQGIGSGALARDSFVFYVEQDAFFLASFARAYALAFAKAPDTSTMVEIRALLDGVFEELELHRGYAQRWGASLEPEPSAATSAYTDFLLRVAWSEPVASIMAAMTPCMRLYAHLGTRLAEDGRPDSPYHEWVDTYADPEFDALAARMEAVLDTHDDGSRTLDRHYRTAMAREYDFFDQAVRG
ncbi:TenA family protein [Egibacter rhizosphaerae]|uniref:TenA family protein n=1 Tax=Egibacter rhizosphaerae TaxID=1670831 RepID=A0A411YEI2_9ACTN|nr:TenA family protein [Egibacter rhizosphaerae]QBI19532.1 TenA family protein [Egibacter rhizosphaerae]